MPAIAVLNAPDVTMSMRRQASEMGLEISVGPKDWGLGFGFWVLRRGLSAPQYVPSLIVSAALLFPRDWMTIVPCLPCNGYQKESDEGKLDTGWKAM